MARDQIFKEVWGEEFMGGTRTLDMHIKALRNRLKEVEITTVRGVGFRLE
jgi:two-component system alkaline phosphatase synthesis response regulator PhoP